MKVFQDEGSQQSWIKTVEMRSYHTLIYCIRLLCKVCHEGFLGISVPNHLYKILLLYNVCFVKFYLLNFTNSSKKRFFLQLVCPWVLGFVLVHLVERGDAIGKVSEKADREKSASVMLHWSKAAINQGCPRVAWSLLKWITCLVAQIGNMERKNSSQIWSLQ